MKKVLSELYYGNINEAEKSIEDLRKSKEFQKYSESLDKLIATFSAEQEKMFDEYFVAEGNYASLERERIYTNGVKLGFALAVELNEE